MGMGKGYLRSRNKASPRVPLRLGPMRLLDADDLPRKYLVENELPLKRRFGRGGLDPPGVSLAFQE